MDKIIKTLESLGFERREIKIYLTLIQNNSLTVLQISKRTKIDRTTIYDILERLLDKGIVSSVIKNKTKHFSAIKPGELLVYFKEKFDSLGGIMKELNNIASQKKEQINCELFYGNEGLKTVLKDLVESKKNYKAIGIRKEYEDILGYFNEQGIIKLNRFKTIERAIVEKDSKFKRLKKGEYRYLNKKLLSPVTTLIYSNRVVFFIWIEPYFAISVENKYFKKAQEEYFELLWGVAKPQSQ